MNKVRTTARLEKILTVLRQRQKDLTLVMANIHDPHNVSAIYRSCDAFGVPRVHLYYTDTAFPALAAKTSASARKWVESVRHKTAGSLFGSLRSEGLRVYATSCSAAARPLHEFDLSKPSAIILGNEHSGVSTELAAMADAELFIPMYGMIQSFNVSVAAALVLHEASRQRREAGLYDNPTYSPEELDALYEAWSQK